MTIGYDQVTQEVGGTAAAGLVPRPGTSPAPSGLVLDLDGAKGGEELLDQVRLFVVQRRAAEAREAHRAASAGGLHGLLPAGPPRLDHPVGDQVHCGGQVQLLPVRSMRPPVQHLVLPNMFQVVSCRLAEPFGHSLPRLTGESGSPSIWMTRPSRT